MCDHSEPSSIQQVNGTNVDETHVAVDTSAARPNGHGVTLRHLNSDAGAGQPFQNRYSDFLSNVSNFKIIESTLRGKSAGFPNVCCRVLHSSKGLRRTRGDESAWLSAARPDVVRCGRGRRA
ncbi:hypothetical protein IE53DRAFT_279328 [Violaceomyces palustris]|uniref:Uncharacterized protein n=1 Tax=Violaceomyces palustris TaxID=1673888 RepID=A0ACD0NMJ3_9BASI|nr:hypothetical protein IE53DRAFT_279328 [Violaceomyces palustris]